MQIYRDILEFYFPESYFWTVDTVPSEHRELFQLYHGEAEIQQFLKAKYAQHMSINAHRALMNLSEMEGKMNASDIAALKVLLETSKIMEMQYIPQHVTVTHYIPSPYAELEEKSDVDITSLV